MATSKPSYATVVKGGTPLAESYRRMLEVLVDEHRREPDLQKKVNMYVKEILPIKAKLWSLHNAPIISKKPVEYDEDEEYDEWYDDDRGCSGGICSCCGRTRDN